jgi:hypothetical protein
MKVFGYHDYWLHASRLIAISCLTYMEALGNLEYGSIKTEKFCFMVHASNIWSDYAKSAEASSLDINDRILTFLKSDKSRRIWWRIASKHLRYLITCNQKKTLHQMP